MENITVEISVECFVELVKKAERVDTLKRLAAADQYLTVSDILAVLGIERKAATADGSKL